MEKMKRDLVRLVKEENTRYPEPPPTPIFDFSGYSFITEEAQPAPGTGTEMRYYWDSSHFKQVVGDYVLDRVYGVSDTARRAPQDFGVQLTEGTIETYLADQRLLQADYRRRFANDFVILRELVANVLNHDHS
jgi:hypothetical protein